MKNGADDGTHRKLWCKTIGKIDKIHKYTP